MKLNKNGKGSAAYLLLVPLILVIGAIVIDTIINYSQEKKYKLITETIVKDIITQEDISEDEYEATIKKFYERNGYKTENMVVEIKGNGKMYLENEHHYSGILTSIFSENKNSVEKVLFGVRVKLAENSKVFLKINIDYTDKNDIKFEYLK